MASTASSNSKFFPSFLRSKQLNNASKNFIKLPTFSSTKFPLRVESSSSSATAYNEAVADEEVDKIRRLQNGSDVRGVAVEGEKGRPVDLTPPAVEAIAESFGEWVRNGLEREGGEAAAEVRVSLGKDPRISGGRLSVAVLAGLARAGCVGFDMGLATTPACFMSTVLPPFSFDASIMVLFPFKHNIQINLDINKLK